MAQDQWVDLPDDDWVDEDEWVDLESPTSQAVVPNRGRVQAESQPQRMPFCGIPHKF